MAFSLPCPTCGTRLRVKSAEAVGQILACPRCSGMVLVPPPPPGSEEPNDAGSASGSGSGIHLVVAAAPQAAPAHDFDFVNDLLAAGPPAPPGGSAVTKSVAAAPPVSPPAKSAVPASATSPVVAASEPPKSEVKAQPKAASAPKGKAAATKPATNETKSATPTASAKAEASAAAVAVVAASAVAAEPAPAAEPATPAAEPKGTAPSASTSEPANSAASAAANAAEPAASDLPAPIPAVSLWTTLLAQAKRLPAWATYSVAAIGGLILALGTIALILALAGPPAPGPGTANAQGEPSAPTPPQPPAPAGAANPTDVTPSPMPPPPPADPPPMPPVVPPVQPLPAPMPVAPSPMPAPLPPPVGPPVTPMPPPSDPAAPVDPGLPEMTTPDEPPPRPPLPAAPVAARMRDRFAKIEFPPTPLVDFAAFATDFSTIPVTLDVEGLRLAGLTAESPITLLGEGIDLRTALQKATDPLLLALVETPQGVVLTQRQLASDTPVPASYPLADLAASPPELEALRQVFLRLALPERADSPTTVRLEGANFVAELPMREQFALMLLVERLRVARGRSPLTGYAKKAPALFKLETPAIDEGFLDQPLRIAIHQPLAFNQVLGRLRQTTKAAFLADWPALHAVNWGPRSTTALSADEIPLRQALDELTRPLGLAWTVAGDRTVLITSRPALAARQAEPTVEFYHLGPRGEKAEMILRPIEEGLVDAGLDLRSVELHWEPAGYLVARAPRGWQARIRQLAAGAAP